MDNVASEILTQFIHSNDAGTIPKNLGDVKRWRDYQNRSQALRWIAVSVGPIRPIWCCSLSDLLPLFNGLSDAGYRGCRFELICEDEMRHWSSLIVMIDQQGCLTTVAMDGLFYSAVISSEVVAAIKSRFTTWTGYVFVSDGVYAPIQGRQIGCRVIAIEFCRRLQHVNTEDLMHSLDTVSNPAMDSFIHKFSLASILAMHNGIQEAGCQRFFGVLLLLYMAERPNEKDKSFKYVADHVVAKAMLRLVTIPGETATLFDKSNASGFNPVVESAKNISADMGRQLQQGSKTASLASRHELDLIHPLICMQLGMLPMLQNTSREQNAFHFMRCIMVAISKKPDALFANRQVPLSIQLRLFRYLVEDKQYDDAHQFLIGTDYLNDFIKQCYQPWQLKHLLVIAINKEQWEIALHIVKRSPLGMDPLLQVYAKVDDCGLEKECLLPLFELQDWAWLKERADLTLTLVEIARCVNINRLPSDSVRLDVIRLELLQSTILRRHQCHLILQLSKTQSLYKAIQARCGFSLDNLRPGHIHAGMIDELLAITQSLCEGKIESKSLDQPFRADSLLLPRHDQAPGRSCCTMC